jgi:hypothetical protein
MAIILLNVVIEWLVTLLRIRVASDSILGLDSGLYNAHLYCSVTSCE